MKKSEFSELESELSYENLRNQNRNRSWNRSQTEIFFGIGVGFRKEKVDSAGPYFGVLGGFIRIKRFLFK
jgi:hypothetical protein